MVRPISLTLRVVINLTIGYFFIWFWVYYGRRFIYDLNLNFVGFYKFFIVHLVLMIVVGYEFFVFFLQRFIFARLLGIYLDELCCYSIKSIIVLSSIGFLITDRF